MIKPYEKLAKLYDENWSQFSQKYLKIILNLKQKYHFNPKSILDIACGTGFLCNKLSTSHTVVGSDISEEMITLARKNYPDIEFIISNMKDISIDKKFDLIVCPFDSINYLIKKTHLHQTLQRTYDLLKQNGYFLFDFNSVRLFTDLFKGSIDRKVKGILFKQIFEFNPKNKIAKTIFDFGNNVREVHIQKAYTYEEMKKNLQQTGFHITYTLDIFNNQETTSDAYKILILATKT